MTAKAAAAGARRVLMVAPSAERGPALRSRLGEGLEIEPAEFSAAARQAQAGVVVILEADSEPPDATSKLGERGAAVIVLTDDTEAGWVAHLLAAGAKAVLHRDCDDQQLAAAVKAAAAGLVALAPDAVQAVLRPPLETIELEPGEEELTPRETEVLRLLTQGLSNREMASILRISEHTVKFHITSIFGKLGTSTRTEAATEGIRRGLVLL